jgi:peptide/nickel transport system ATP-binding protein
MNDKEQPLLQVEELSILYHSQSGVVKALDSVHLAVRPKEFLAVVGESGSGKSTLALSIIGLLPQNAETRGKIVYKGNNMAELSKEEWTKYRGTEIGMIFQEPLSSLNPVQKIGGQMLEALRIENTRRGGPNRVYNYSARSTLMTEAKPSRDFEARLTGSIGALRSNREAMREVYEWLRKVRIADPEGTAEKYPFELSGGMMQRVMIAMALSQKPSLLLADEPTTALDVTTQAQILELMRTLMDSQDTAVLLITHDLGVAAQVADRVVVLYAGDVVEDAPVQELFSNPLHPYTKGLLKSYPKGTKIKEKLETLPGAIPDLRKEIVGCKFADRCQFVSERCRNSRVHYVETEKGHHVRCTLYY